MPNFFIFVKNCGGSWDERDRKLLKKQMAYGWDIGERTVNRKCIRPEDRALIYISGPNAKVFVGDATVKTSVYKMDQETKKKYMMFPLAMFVGYWLEFRTFRLWKRPISIYDIIHDMAFIKNKKNFGSFIQGGVIRISKRDFDYILRNRS